MKKGTQHSEETRQKISQSMKRFCENMSEEMKEEKRNKLIAYHAKLKRIEATK
ncbi:MAG: hypothetical protein IJ352_10715 [Muribaculaceae bacterium]|nr:hypothetical protein [Muribaculaceae bacterium]MBQ7855471.1 hypothetical protein [Muribaculaceae bacterium]